MEARSNPKWLGISVASPKPKVAFLENLTTKLNAKWVLRAINSNGFWALLLKRHCSKVYDC